MKCEACLKVLEEYLDSELAELEAEQVSAHLITCVGCAGEFESLTAEQEIYERYDRALNISPAMWESIAARTATASALADRSSRPPLRDRIAGFFAPPSLGWSISEALAILLIAILIGAVFLRWQRPPGRPDLVVKVGKDDPGKPPENPASGTALVTNTDDPKKRESNHDQVKASLKATRKTKSASANAVVNQSDVLFSDVAYLTVEEQETERHLEQAQNLLRSVRNIEFSEDDREIDVTYEKTLSRQLLNENVVLRRDAEMSGKFPVKTLLSSLEPFLLDIANLPDKASPEDLQVIRDRVQKTEIVAALHSY